MRWPFVAVRAKRLRKFDLTTPQKPVILFGRGGKRSGISFGGNFMPVIACPGCGKQYSVPATAAGQVAKCACGKRFKLGSSEPSSSTTTSSKTTSASASPSKRTSGEPALAGGASPKAKSSTGPSSPNSTAVKATPKPAAPKLATASTPAITSATKSASTSIRPSALEADDDFWNEGLKPDPKPKDPEPAAKSPMVSGLVANSATSSVSKSVAAPAKKKKKKRASWGFDWGKVVAGLAAFLFFGGLTVALVMTTGRISRGTIYLAFPAIGGLFTAINGLMGEEGIW
jgi:hypothetical protein